MATDTKQECLTTIANNIEKIEHSNIGVAVTKQGKWRARKLIAEKPITITKQECLTTITDNTENIENNNIEVAATERGKNIAIAKKATESATDTKQECLTIITDNTEDIKNHNIVIKASITRSSEPSAGGEWVYYRDAFGRLHKCKDGVCYTYLYDNRDQDHTNWSWAGAWYLAAR